MVLIGMAATIAGGALLAWAARSTAGLHRSNAERAALVAGLMLAAAGVAAAISGTA